MDELEPDADLSEEVESIFDPLKFAELEITVRLPGECMPGGEPYKFGYRQMLSADDVRIEDPFNTLPPELERIMRMLEMTMRFR